MGFYLLPSPSRNTQLRPFKWQRTSVYPIRAPSKWLGLTLPWKKKCYWLKQQKQISSIQKTTWHLLPVSLGTARPCEARPASSCLHSLSGKCFPANTDSPTSFLLPNRWHEPLPGAQQTASIQEVLDSFFPFPLPHSLIFWDRVSVCKLWLSLNSEVLLTLPPPAGIKGVHHHSQAKSHFLNTLQFRQQQKELCQLWKS